MPKIKSYPVTLRLRITYADGNVEVITDIAKIIHSRFRTLLVAYNTGYHEPISIEILDYKDKVWKSFIQNY